MQLFEWVFLFSSHEHCWAIGWFWSSFSEASSSRFPQGLCQLTFMPTMRQVSLFSTASSRPICCRLDKSLSDRYEVVSHRGLDLHLPDSDVGIFSCACWPPVHLWKNAYSFLCPLFNWVFWYWILWVLKAFYTLIPYWTYDLKYILSFSRLPVCFADGFLCWAKSF